MTSIKDRNRSMDPSLKANKSVTLFFNQVFQSLQAEEQLKANKNALCLSVLVYYQRFVNSSSLLRSIRHELRTGRYAIGAARLLCQWILLRYQFDFRGQELLYKLIDIFNAKRIRSRMAAFINVDLLIMELNSAKLALLRAVHQARIVPTTTTTVISPLHLAIADELTLRPNKTPLLRRFLSIQAQQAAALLTLIDYEYLASINLAEFFNQGWKDPRRSPRLGRFVTRTNRISQWVASSVLVQPTVNLSSRVASDFIRIAYFCYENGNYLSSLAIMQAFDLSYVARLRKLWKISEETRALAKRIELVGLHKENYKAYRHELRKRRNAGQGAIPMLAVHQKDLTMIEEGNPDHLPDGSVNIEKLVLLGQTLCELAFMQQTAPTAHLNRNDLDVLRNLLETLPCKSEAELEKRSDELRPRASQLMEESSSSSWAAASSDLPLSARTATDESSSSGGSSHDDLVDV